MKNVIIMGIGRTGKTTLSNMLKEKNNSYNLIHSDSIKWAIIRAKGLEEYYRVNIKEQAEFEHSEEFQKTLLYFFKSAIDNDEQNYGHILESGQLHPKLVSELIDQNNTTVICLGHGELTKEDIIKLCRDNDNEKDWSYELTDEELEAHATKWALFNEELKRDCAKYGIEYIDTSKNRIEILNNTLEKIINS